LHPKPSKVPERAGQQLTKAELCHTLWLEGTVMDKILIPMIIVLPLILFWLWMAWDLGGNDSLSSNEKFYWMLAFLFMNVFGAVFYYVYEYKKRH
jgi:hypothetical protein